MAELFSILTYDYTKNTDILDIADTDTWTPIVSLTTNTLDSLYEQGLAIQGTFADVNDSWNLRFRVDAGTWNVFRSEPKDVADTFGIYYAYPKVMTAGSHTIEVEMAKDVGGSQLDVQFADVWIERKG